MNERTKLSSKGQVVIPKTLRDRHGWTEGTQFELVDGEKGVLLKPVVDIDALFPPITMEEFLSRAVKIDRFPTDEEIEETILAEAGRRFDATSR